ncbi:calcium-dependent protein kinase 24 [Drosophila madeirensis]|uniref:Doublecortin-like and CAM kinase-like protein n=1 Tax=Drosophila madeirensis TaxID=30013 RepID=A0AAU9F4L7_DROMD
MAVVRSTVRPMKAVRVCFLRNGDPHFRGVTLSVSRYHYNDFDILLGHVTKALHSHVVLPSAIECIWRIDGTPIGFLDAFLDGDAVVCCCRYESFSKMDYSVNRHFGRLQAAIRRWKVCNEALPEDLPDSILLYVDKRQSLVSNERTAICMAEPKSKQMGSCIVKVVNEAFMQSLDAKYKEMEIMRKLQSHPNVVDLIFTVHRPKASHTFLVMECMACSVQDLRKLHGSIPEPTAKRIMRDVVCGLTHIHDEGIIHRDIKPDNLLIADFGAAIYFKERAAEDYVGTPKYIAPEMIIGTGYDYRVDTWAVGVTLFCMLFDEEPFGKGCKEPEAICHDIVARGHTFPLELKDSVSKDAKDLIDELLMKNPNFRPTSAEISKHPFMLRESITDFKDLKKICV